MGQVFIFTCECGYTTEVHGGPGGIFAIELVSVACSDCKEVSDVGLGLWDEYPEMRSGLTREERLRAEKEYMQIYRDRIQRQSCPECGGRNFTPWGKKMGSDRRPTSKGADYACPRCDRQMTRSRHGMSID